MSLVATTGVSHALGIGQPSSRAVLGERLSVTVPVRVEVNESLDKGCLAADVYFGDDKLPVEDIDVALMPGWSAERTIKIHTRQVVHEPVVTVYLIAGCQSKITRKFVAFADPPGLAPMLPSADAPGTSLVAQVPLQAPEGSARLTTGTGTGKGAEVAGAASSAKPQRAKTKSSAEGTSAKKQPAQAKTASSKKVSSAAGSGSATAATNTATTAATASTAAPRALAQAPSLSISPTAQRSASASAAKRAPDTAPASGVARLVLDDSDVEVVNLPGLRMTTNLLGVAGDQTSPEVLAQRAAAAALWRALNASPEDMARDQLRVAELEQRLAALQAEAKQSREAAVALQARVAQAEGRRWITYVLGALALLLGGALAWVILRQRKEKGQGVQWWKEEGAATAAAAANANANANTASPAASREPSLEDAYERERAEDAALLHAVAAMASASGGRDQAFASSAGGQSRSGADITVSLPDDAPAQSHVGRDGLSDPEELMRATGAGQGLHSRALDVSPREVSVEELIDLEQQAEFFVVLGQDDAAIDLLEAHVQSTTGASPLPFLKLLEVYQRLGRREDYERTQAEFNERFNGYAPAWDANLQQGHELADYPGIIERLQAMWGTPAQAMDVLERSLTRPDADVETFDLPAYRELILLYAVARDRHERETVERPAVDLVTPVADVDAPAELGDTSPIIEPLMATRPMKAQPEMTPSISVDLSLDDLEAEPQPEPQPAATGGPIEFERVDSQFDQASRH